MDVRVVALLLVVGLAAGATSIAAPPAPPQDRVIVLEVTAQSCPHRIGGEWLCLAYNGQVPGPMIDVNLGDTLVIVLYNNISTTIGATNASAATKARLANVDVSWHVHGTAMTTDMDGIHAVPGTNLIESVAHPGGSFTYRTRAAFAGSWHYHDHVLGLDGDEGVARGLYGGLIVRTAGEPRPDAVLDLHMLDAGANGGRGLDATLAAGSDFEMLVVGLKNLIWRMELRAPDDTVVGSYEAGPGMSERIVVRDAVVGDYRWSATGLGVKTGTVRVQ